MSELGPISGGRMVGSKTWYPQYIRKNVNFLNLGSNSTLKKVGKVKSQKNIFFPRLAPHAEDLL